MLLSPCTQHIISVALFPQVGGGARAVSAMFCIKGGPPASVEISAGRAGRCFPNTGAALGRIAMSEVAIGDAVQCLVPAGIMEIGADARDDAQIYVQSVCHVFGYLDADMVRAQEPAPHIHTSDVPVCMGTLAWRHSNEHVHKRQLAGQEY
mgnify:CR=1 FL=1